MQKAGPPLSFANGTNGDDLLNLAPTFFHWRKSLALTIFKAYFPFFIVLSGYISGRDCVPIRLDKVCVA